MTSEHSLPAGLRRWFVVHFAVDVLAAVPLFAAPDATLRLLGWKVVDPLATRLVAAALFGIGIQSFLGRNESAGAFRAMLNLKIIWSAAACLGLLWSALEGASPIAWAFFAIFAGFNAIWIRYRIALGVTVSDHPGQSQ